MNTRTPLARRQFLQKSSAATAAIVAAPWLTRAAAGAHERIRIGMIGTGDRASQLMKEILAAGEKCKVDITAVCDVWKTNREAAVGRVKQASGTEPKQFTRFAELLARPEVDAVVIATPDFSHGQILVAALEAGKDVYIEKPMTASTSTNALSRRHFVRVIGASAAALALQRPARGAAPMKVKIAKVESFPINYPVVGRFKFFEGPAGRPSGRAAVVVKITADNGVVGWGQSVPVPRWSYETLETVHSTLTRYLTPELLGRDPFDFDGIHSAMNHAIAPSFSTGQPICKAGVDLALFDLTGKLLQQSAAQRWGRKGRERLTLSWTLNPRTLDEVEPLIAQGRARGYRNFNVKVAPDPKFDLELCRIVKRLVPDGFLWADANGGYDEATALAVAPKLADLGVPVLEQPLPANRLDGYRKLKQQGALPIIMDEGIVSTVELEEFIKLGLLDGVAMKPARCGGITEARRQIEILQRAGLKFLGSGLTDPDLSLAASLALFGAYDLKYPAALNGPQFLGASILKHPFEVKDGELTVPTGHGLGVEVDEAKMRELLVKDV